MSEVTDDLVTRGDDGGELQARIAAMTQRMLANPDNIGLRLRLGHLLEEAGRQDEAVRVLGEAVARFPNNKVAKMRLDTLQARPVAAPVPDPAPTRREPEAAEPPPSPPTPEPAASTPVPERRFAAQDELLSLARAAQGVGSGMPAAAAAATATPGSAGHPAAPTHLIGLQAEPSLRLRLNPLHPRYRAEIYFAAALITAIALSGVVAFRSSHSGLLIDRDVATPIVLAPRQAAPAPPSPPPELSPQPAPESPLPPASEPSPPTATLPPVTVPRAVVTEPDILAANTPALSFEAPAPLSPAPPSPAPPSPDVIAGAAGPPLPERTALPEVTLDYPARDARAARAASDLAARLQRAGIAARPVARPGTRQDAGITFFYAEDAALARSVAAELGDMGQARQAPIPPGGDVLPGAIRIALPARPERRRPG